MPTQKKRRSDSVQPMPPHRRRATAFEVNPEDVARRAFELYCARGRKDGYALDDWLSAERELFAVADVNTAA